MAKVEFRKTNVKLLQIELQRQMHAYQKWSIQHLNQYIWGEHYKIQTFSFELHVAVGYSSANENQTSYFCLKFQNKKIAIGFSFMIVRSFWSFLFDLFIYLLSLFRSFNNWCLKCTFCDFNGNDDGKIRF